MVNEGTNHFGIHDSELFEMDEKFDFQFERTTLEFESFRWAAAALNCVVDIFARKYSHSTYVFIFTR